MNNPIITLRYSFLAKFFLAIFAIVAAMIVIDNYNAISPKIIVLGLLLLCLLIIFLGQTTYQLYPDKIVRTAFGIQTILPINETTICYEHRPPSTKIGSDKPKNEFHIITEVPKKRFKIYDNGWENYAAFKEEVENIIKRKSFLKSKSFEKNASGITVVQTQKIDKKFSAFNQKVSNLEAKAVANQKQTYKNIGIGFGCLLSLSGLFSLLDISILSFEFSSVVSDEPFVIVIGILMIIYYSVFSKGYD